MAFFDSAVLTTVGRQPSKRLGLSLQLGQGLFHQKTVITEWRVPTSCLIEEETYCNAGTVQCMCLQLVGLGELSCMWSRRAPHGNKSGTNPQGRADGCIMRSKRTEGPPI
jgi:hypothetical protein